MKLKVKKHILQRDLNVSKCLHYPFIISQGWLVSSTIDYLSSDFGSLSFTWVLAIMGWLGPTLLMVYSHVIINTHHRSLGLNLN